MGLLSGFNRLSVFALQVSGGGSTSSGDLGEGEAGTLIDLDQLIGNFRKSLKKIRVLILVKKAVKMS